MFAGEAAQILDNAPDLFVRQLPAKSNHASTGRSVLDHPEYFTFRTMAPQPMVPEIAGRWIQLGSQRPIAVPIFSMTVEASPLSVVERLALVSARASASLSAGTSDCIMCRSAATAGAARETMTAINGNIFSFINFLLSQDAEIVRQRPSHIVQTFNAQTPLMGH
jgi:hypothetical protein